MSDYKNGGRPRPEGIREGKPILPGEARPAPADGKTRTVDTGAAQRQQGGKKRRRKKKKVSAITVMSAILVNIFKAALVMFCVALMVGSVVVVQVVQYVVAETQNDDNLLDIENIKLNQTSYILAQDPASGEWVEYQELIGPENRIWVNLSEIPDDLVHGVVATEDRQFYEHHGVNFERTAYALLNELFQLEDNTFGASTIHQQLVKNITGDDDVVGDDGDRSEGYRRKLREIFRAWGLANRYSKDMVMEAYLNTMGLSERIAGVEAGAREYFGKQVKDLTLAECATIAGITQAPTRYSPFQNPENCLKRRDNVLYFMYEEGYITQDQYTNAIAQPLGVTKRTNKETGESREVFSYFSDKVFNDVVDDLMVELGISAAEAQNRIYTGGYRIYATIDLTVQNALDDIYVDGYSEEGYFMNQSKFPNYASRLTYYEENPDGSTTEILPQSAAVVINYDGELLATVGGIGEKTESLSLNRSIGTVDENGNVTGTVRQVGSTMKPIAAYALGLDTKIITYSSMVRDVGVLSRNPVSNPNAKDWPKNFSNRYRNSNMPIVSAIAESTNTVAAQVGLWVGRQEMFEYLVDTLEITSLVQPNDVDIAPLALGSQEYGMCAYELAGAYQPFGGNGQYGVFNSLHSYKRVEDTRGNIVLQPERVSVQAVDPQTGYIMNRLLSEPLRGSGLPGGATGTARGMAPEGEMDSVAKTGTTSDDRDRWFVGLTPYYITAVWWGYDIQDKYDFNGRWGPAAGTNVPPNVWKDLMETVQAELPVKEFPEVPEGIEELRWCTSSGLKARAGCPSRVGYFASWNIPEDCKGHRTETPEGEEAPPAA